MDSTTFKPTFNKSNIELCFEENIPFIVIDNICVFSKCCENIKLQHWLSGRTLLYTQKVGCLPNENFDSVAVKIISQEEIEKLLNILIEEGFQIIKVDKWNALLNKNGRDLDISCYVSNGIYLRHRNIMLKHSYFDNLIRVIKGGGFWCVPNHSDELIDDIYTSSINLQYFRTLPFLAANNNSIFKVARKLLSKVVKLSPQWAQNISYLIGNKQNNKRIILTEHELREIYFEEDPINWKIRKPHLDLITCNGKYRKVGEIIDYLNNTENLKAVRNEITETIINCPFLEPIYFSKTFWLSGNSNFINCILYTFRKGVVPYEEANIYINRNKPLNLFSAEYYQSLELMDDNEIKSFLKDRPIVIENNKLVGGRHRVCAMIGRLITDQPYIPVHSLEI